MVIMNSLIKTILKNHINGIENFWGIAKVRLAKSYADLEKIILISISKNVNLDIKYKGIRHSMRYEDVYHELLKLLREEVGRVRWG